VVAKTKGIKELFDEVIDTGLCASCGACVGDCPYMVYYKGKVRMLDLCGRDEGHCYEYCPRTRTDLDSLSRKLFAKPYDGSEIGTVKDIFMARSTDPKILKKAQYGGTVTALLALALAEKAIDKAILCRTDKDRMPAGHVASSAKEILQCAGSNYIAYPALEALNRMPRGSRDRLGIVLTPCQSIALAKMRLNPANHRADIDNVSLVVGLFCTWALAYDGFTGFLRENVDLPKVKKFDIPPPPANRFDVYTGKEVKSFTLDEVRQHRMPTCAYCLDMTAEFSDISVGAVEGKEGWNTVIVRSKRGADIIETAVRKGVLETRALPQQNLAHLEEASLLKKTRGLKEIVSRTGSRNDLLYLEMPDDVREGLLGSG